MEIRRINEFFSVSAQIAETDLPELHAAGVELIVCNRPDDEEPGQPSFEQIKRAAHALGIEAARLAFPSEQMGEDVPAAFARLLGRRWRTHAYCRTGRRSLNAYAAARALDARFTPEHLAELSHLAGQLGFEGVDFQFLKHKPVPRL